MGFLSSLIAPAVGLVGSIFGANSAASGQRATNVANAQQAALNREFQAEEAKKARQAFAYLSNTEYQRAMADMRKAGLNPILAYQQGGASASMGSSPSGSMAVYQNPNALSSQLLSQGINSAFQNYEVMSRVDKMNAEVALIAEKTLTEPTFRYLNTMLEGKTSKEILNLVETNAEIRQRVTESKARVEMMARQLEQAGVTSQMLRENPRLAWLAGLMEVLGIRVSPVSIK